MTQHIHIDNPEHNVDMDEVKILAVKWRWTDEGVREVMHISMEQPSLNKDGSRYNLPSIWHNVLRLRAVDSTDDR